MSEKMNAEKFELANKWLRLQNKNISILQNLKVKGIEGIVLYGASEFAVRLLEQCEKENMPVKIVAIADKKISSMGTYYKDIPLISINDIAGMNRDTICVVVTAMGFYDEIADELQNKGITNVKSLKDIIYDAYC